jgi:hypothetical protein
MKVILSKGATGNIKSKILDPKYHTAELVFEAYISPSEFARIMETYDEKEFEIEIKEKENIMSTPIDAV